MSVHEFSQFPSEAVILPEKLPRRVLIVTQVDKPPLAAAIADAFRSRGMETRVFYSWLCNTWFDRLVIRPANHYARTLRLIPKSQNLFQGHPKSHKEWRSRQAIELCRDFKPELILITGVQRFKPEVLEEFQATGAVFYWFTESETRFHEIEHELPYYDHIYCISSLSMKQARSLGRSTSLLLHAVNTFEFHPLNLPKIYDWCFVGQWHPRRQEYAEGLAEVSKKFAIYGPRWRRRTWNKPALWLGIKGKGIWEEKLNRLYNQTKVVINISVWGDEKKGSHGVNMRLLEVPACRTCLLSDYASDAQKLLVPDREFVSAATLPEMQAKLAELLHDDKKREEIAAAGYQKATTVRTYGHLVAEICTDWARLKGF
ncbi:MAG: glycosyltransferase [Deltaproteobacteria bacterium]|nr:glycosyltransferase [Deltaproteobacteria bacterium]